jgi:uncharacterized protein (TIGR02147 family)
MNTLFESKSYQEYLKSWLKAQPNRGRGLKSELARAAGCQLTYVSRVFAGVAQLSLEQAEAVSRFLGHTDEEADYFLLLIQHARAGNPRLRSYFGKKLTGAREKRLVLKERFKVKAALTSEYQGTYYSQWFYAAIHLLLSIPATQSREAIAKYLGLPLRTVSQIVDFLVSTGLAQEEKGRLQIGTSRIHVGHDSPWVAKHHINWRLQAIQAMEKAGVGSQDLHYTSIVSVSREDAQKIKAVLVDTLEKFNETVRLSAEETAQCLVVDFFGI